jgi:hypothetical protein
MRSASTHSAFRAALAVMTLLATTAASESPTLRKAEPPQAEQKGSAVFQDASWLAGRWTGAGLGGEIEEVWSPPAGGQMVGHFSLVRKGAVALYEMEVLDPSDQGLRMRVKHFSGGFVGWEEKGAWHTFEAISADRNELRFSGLTMRREGDRRLVITLVLKDSAGDHVEVLRLERAS